MMQLRDVPEITLLYVLDNESDLTDAVKSIRPLLHHAIQDEEIFTYLESIKPKILELKNQNIAEKEKPFLDNQLLTTDEVYMKFYNLNRSTPNSMLLHWRNLPATVKEYCLGNHILARHNLGVYPLQRNVDEQFQFIHALVTEKKNAFFQFYIRLYQNVDVLCSLYKTLASENPTSIECHFTLERIAQLRYIDSLKNKKEVLVKADLSRENLVMIKLNLQTALTTPNPQLNALNKLWENKTFQSYMLGTPLLFSDQTIEALTVEQQLKFLLIIINAKLDDFFKIILRNHHTNRIFVALRNYLNQKKMYPQTITMIDDKINSRWFNENKFKNNAIFLKYITSISNNFVFEPTEDNLQLLKNLDVRVVKYLIGETITLDDHTKTTISRLSQANIFSKLFCPEYEGVVLNFIGQIENKDTLELLAGMLQKLKPSQAFLTAVKERAQFLAKNPVDHHLVVIKTIENLIRDLQQKSVNDNLKTLNELHADTVTYLIGDSIILKNGKNAKISEKLQKDFFKTLLAHHYVAHFENFIGKMNDHEILKNMKLLVHGHTHESTFKTKIDARLDTLMDILLQKELLQANKNMKELEEFLLGTSTSTTPSSSTSTTSTSNYNNSNVMYPADNVSQTSAKKRPFDEISTPTASKK